MKKVKAVNIFIPEDGASLFEAEGFDLYFSSEVDARIAELRGALADIAFSSDMTLKVARAKATRIYESTAN